VAPTGKENARGKLIDAATLLFRRNGYVATSVDEICAEAGVTKGACFHHFDSKESLAKACLKQWESQVVVMHENAPFQSIADPLEKLLGCIEYFAGVFENRAILKSCLAGTTVQEVAETNPALREAAQACFLSGENLFRALLDNACNSRNVRLDTQSLAKLWMATLQGSLLLFKASRDDTVIPRNLRHFRNYVEQLFAIS
jgi:TetR/AcrR family transcriptional repressor of nem operon